MDPPAVMEVRYPAFQILYNSANLCMSGSGSKSSVSPENAAVVRPSSWDSGYDPSSSSAHSLSPSQGNHTSLPGEIKIDMVESPDNGLP